ncbi:MAG: ABC transporter ATP-binding protein [Flavobacteriales bacterium]|nr:ABC transporter ATP-binding protein [Flavobacteriales bacterium]
MKAPLSTEALAVGYPGRRLVERVDIALRPGELVALIGVNGGGKSTLLHTLAGLHPPLAGKVRSLEAEIGTLSAVERARRMALVLTGRPAAGLMDVRTLVAMGRQPWTGHFGRLTEDDHRIIDGALQAVDVVHLAGRQLRELSDGEAQRVMIARALAQDTPVMLLDEPMAFLDLVNRLRLLRTLRQLAHDRQKAVLLSTHDLQSALDLCDRLLLIHDGRLWNGTPADAVVSGVLEALFSGEGLRFDPATRSFRAS